MQEPTPSARPHWLDLILYVLVGYGLPSVIGFIFLETTNASVPPTWFTAIVTLTNLVSLGGAAIVLGVLRHKFSLAEIGFFPVKWQWRWWGWVAGIVVLTLPVRMFLGWIAQILVEGNMDSVAVRGQIVSPDGASWANFWIALIGIGLLAPVSEELFFRGALYLWFRGRYGVVIAVASSSLLFAAAHSDSAGAVAASLVIGVVNAIVFERTKSLWMAIAIHAFNNTLAVLLIYGAMALAPLAGAT